MEQIHHIHHNFPTKAGRLAGVFKKRHPSRLSKKVCSPLGPLCEGDSPQRGEMSRSDRGAWARRAPPAGGGGENCTAARNISGYGKVLSLRPFGAPPSQRCVQIHGQPFHENQHRHILLADFSAPIFHFQKNVNLHKVYEVDYAEKDCNNCCSLFGLDIGICRLVYAFSSDYLQFKRFGRQAFCFHRDRNLSGGIAAADHGQCLAVVPVKSKRKNSNAKSNKAHLFPKASG